MGEPKITLLTKTEYPLETVYSVWHSSKTEEPLITPAEVAERRKKDPEFDAEVRSLFSRVIRQRIPVGDHVDFVFMLEDISVSLREQLVRHRVGVNPSPERLGVDIVVDKIPDLSASTWWSQSMRIQDMSEFANKRKYRIPESLKDNSVLLREYETHMRRTADLYKVLLDSGIPMEDARELIPLGAQHRISWRLSIGALQHIIGERGCWILQLGIWGPVIKGIINELVDKVDPVFADMVTPPCIKADKFSDCVYQEENRRRYTGDDKLPPCPLHFYNHELGVKDRPKAHHPDFQEKVHLPMASQMRKRATEYQDFWWRNPYTGERLDS